MDEATVGGWLTEWSSAWCVPDLAGVVRIEISRRMRRSLGRCHPRTGLIRLNAALLGEPEELQREVLCHEAAHVAVYLLHRNRNGVRPHGLEWKQLMRAAGFGPRVRMDPARLSRKSQEAVRPAVCYRHRCPVCGASRVAGRPVHRWRCRACHESGLKGKLEISAQPRAALDPRAT